MNSWALTAYYKKKNHNQNKTQINNNHQKRVLDSALFPVKIFLQYHPSILQPDTGKKNNYKERDESWGETGSFIHRERLVNQWS